MQLILTRAVGQAWGIRQATQREVVMSPDSRRLDADVASAAQPASCETVAWCDATCGDFTPDVRGTRTARWHTRRFDEVVTQGGAHATAGLTTLRVSLGQSELPPEEVPQPGDHDTTVWVDVSRPGLGPIELSVELTVDQAAAFAGSLAAAVSAARRSE